MLRVRAGGVALASRWCASASVYSVEETEASKVCVCHACESANQGEKSDDESFL